MGLSLCKLEPDIWMKQNRDIYSYFFVYVDELSIAARDPKSLILKIGISSIVK